MNGSTIVVPKINNSVAVVGQVLQPGIFELHKKMISVSEILKFSGVTYNSQSLRLSKQTILPSGKQELKNISNIDEKLKPNDILFVSFLQNPTKSGGIKLIGEVNSQEVFPVTQFPNLSNVFSIQNLLNSNSYTFSALVRRFNNISNKFNYIVVNLNSVLLGKTNFSLKSDDEIIILSKNDLDFLVSDSVINILFKGSKVSDEGKTCKSLLEFQKSVKACGKYRQTKIFFN